VLDVKRIREDPDPFRKALARRNLADAVDRLLDVDERRRSLLARVE
jgi:seryl-tRNA synthetase